MSSLRHRFVVLVALVLVSGALLALAAPARADSQVLATGYNADGQCNVSGWTDIVQVAGSVGDTVGTTIGLKSDGTVVAVGLNDWGQCNVSGWTNIVQVSAGQWHTVGLRSDGTVVAVGGYNGWGEVSGVFLWTNIVQVAAGAMHTVGLKSDGTVVAVGDNWGGQLDGISAWSDIVQIAAGGHFEAGLKADGTVVALGRAGLYDVSGWTDIVQVACGNSHVVGLKADGTVVASGDNSRGQCDVSGWSDIVQVAAGQYHTVGLKADGTVVAVGDNSAGQCNVSGWSNISQVACGVLTTLGLHNSDTTPPAATIDEFPVPNVHPSLIAAGPDGNLWFTQWQSSSLISRITTAGVVTQWPTPSAMNTAGITAGPDGNVWFAEELYGGTSGGCLAKVTPAGEVTEYPIPTQDQFSPMYVAADPAGNIWYTDGQAWGTSNIIGKFTIANGSFTEYPIPWCSPHGITVGPDGNIWFAGYGNNCIGRMTPSGVVTTYPVPTAGTGPYNITTGADGNLWFSEHWGSSVGRITTSGVITEFPIPSGYGVEDVAAGPDGNIWFTEWNNNKIGEITPAGAITEYDVPTANSNPAGITAGPDGNMWFTEAAANKIGRVTLHAGTGDITGTITDTNNVPLQGMKIRVYASVSDYFNDVDYKGWAVTDSYGHYDVSGLPAGDGYVIWFNDNGSGNYITQFYDDQPSMLTATPVTVTAGGTTSGINATFVSAGHITGTVTGVGDAGLPGVKVIAYKSDGSGGWIDAGWTVTGTGGTYNVGSLLTGRYRVRFGNGEGAYYYRTQYYDNKPTIETADPVDVTLGQTTPGINVTLAPAGHITGTVTDTDNDPLWGMKAYAYASMPDYYDGIVASSSGTDGDGKYDMGDLPSGSYIILFTDNEAGDYVNQFYNDRPVIQLADPVAVSVGQTTSGIDATLDAARHITGTVTDASLTGLEGIKVQAYRSNGSGGWDAAGFTHTGADGSYDLGSLVAGTYRLYFGQHSPSYVPAYYGDKGNIRLAADVQVTDGQMTSGIDMQLAPAGHITGTVRDTANVGLGDIVVEVYSANDVGGWDLINFVFTDSGGTYDATAPGGTFRVMFRDNSGAYVNQYYNDKGDIHPANDVSVTVGETTSGINATLAPAGPVGHITGTVKNAGGDGLAGIKVIAYESDGSGGWNDVSTTWTNDNGTYNLGGVPAGNCRLYFGQYSDTYLPQFYNGEPGGAEDIDSAKDVPVGLGETVALPDVVLVAASITGTITDATGQPLDNIDVKAFASADDAYTGNWVALTQTDEHGTYRLGGLPEGDYIVEFSNDESGDYVTQYYDGLATPDSATLVHVTDTTTTKGIDAALLRVGCVAGTVTDADGNGLDDISVSACVANSQGGWDGVATVQTQGGGYDLGPLPAGSYRIMFRDDFGRWATQWYNNKPDFFVADDVTVTHSTGITGVDATLAPAGHISGTVKDASGVGLAGMKVSAYLPDGSGGWDKVNFAAVTDAGGGYDLGGLPAGSYHIGFRDPSGTYTAQYYDAKSDIRTGDPVAVTAGGTTSGINAVLWPPPSITAVAPSLGSVGTSVTITGTRFSGATAVTFNGRVATQSSIASDTAITAIVPVGASSGPIAVTTPGGAATSAASFTVVPLTISVKAMSGPYVQASTLPVSWTTNTPVSAGEFQVSVQSSLGTTYASQTVAPNGGVSYASTFSLAKVPVASGYQVVVAYRPTAGSGAFTATGTGSFAVVPLTINVDPISGTYPQTANLSVTWTTSGPVSSSSDPLNTFDVSVQGHGGIWHVGTVPANGTVHYTTPVGLASVPVGSGYTIVVRYMGAGGATGSSGGGFGIRALGITVQPLGGSYYQASDLPVSWTTTDPVFAGEFLVSIVDSSGRVLVSANVPPRGGAYATSLSLANVPIGTGYKVVVAYRLVPGSAFMATATSGASFAVRALTINVQAIKGSYYQAAGLPVSWTTSDPVSGGRFEVSVESPAGATRVVSASANGGTSYSAPISFANVPPGSNYQVVVRYIAAVGPGVGFSSGTFTVRGLTINVNAISGSFVHASNLAVSWTTSDLVLGGGFDVSVQSPGGPSYPLGSVPANNNSTSYATTVTLAGVSVGSGYRVLVRYDAPVGPGLGSSGGSFQIVPMAILNLTQPTGSLTQGSGLRITWTTSGPVSRGYFEVSLFGPAVASPTYYDLGTVAADGSSSYATNAVLAAVPVGSGYRLVVRYFGPDPADNAGASGGKLTVGPLTITVSRVTGTYSKSSILTVSWKTNGPVSTDGPAFGVCLFNGSALNPRLWDLGWVAPNGTNSYTHSYSLAGVDLPVGQHCYVWVSWGLQGISATTGISSTYFIIGP